jgi:hypothetical protein
MLTATDTTHELLQTLQHNIKLWESLLHAIGGKLELSKCKFTCFRWTSDSDGTVALIPTPTIGQAIITDSETQQQCMITEIPPTEAYKLLGVQMALTGHPQAQQLALTEKTSHLIRTFVQAPLPTSAVRLGYNTVALPTLKYGLAATAIPWHLLDKIQQPLTHAILPKMGYNRHLPRAIVYAPEQLGGLGIQQLAVEQGIAHVQHLIGSIRAHNENYRTIMTLLESYIITSGILSNPLVNMMPTPYIDARWIETTRIFLHSINASIHIPALATIELHRKNDKGLMASAHKYMDKPRDILLISQQLPSIPPNPSSFRHRNA